MALTSCGGVRFLLDSNQRLLSSLRSILCQLR